MGYTYYYDDKNVVEAIKVLELGLKNKGEHEASSLLLAKILYREGKAAYHALNYPVSIEYLNKLVLSHPKNERAQAYLGFAYFNSKKYAEALKAFKVVKEVARPMNVDVYYPNFSALMTFAASPTGTAPAVKMILLELEKYETIFDDGEKLRTEQNNEAALLKFEEALAYFTTINDKWNMEMSITCIGLCHQDLGNYEKAKEQYIKSINLGSDNEDPYANYALLLYAIDKNFDLAATILSQGLAKYPETESLFNVTGRMHIAKAYEFYNAEDYSGSIPHFENGLGYRNDARAYIFLGYAYNELSQVDKAVEAWDNAFYYDEALITEFQDVYDFVQSRK